jgi:tetratricopeptide (TPR) repeat protein
VPLAAWWLVARTGHGAPADRNYLNVAWELYGRGLTWEQFESQVGSRFHSMASVLAYDPLHVMRRVATNLVLQRGRDAAVLMPVWVGALAIPGIALLATRRAWRVPLAFAALAALPLAAVFYNPRFALYLLPFELAGAAAVLVSLERRLPARAVRAGAVALLAGSSVAAGVDLHRSLAQAPDEIRWAADWLRGAASSGDAVMARKPHAAALAGLRFASMSEGRSAVDLAARARRDGVRYVLYSPLERVMRPEYAALADSGFRLPDLEPRFRRAHGTHFAVVYEVSREAPDSAAAVAALRRWIVSRMMQAPRTAEDGVLASIQLMNLEDYGNANVILAQVQAVAGTRDASVFALRSNAWLGLGALDSSYTACERAMRLTPPTAWHWARLGEIRARQRRVSEAREDYRRAIAIEPASVELWAELGRLSVVDGDARAGALAFERALALDPDDLVLRRMAMGAWQRAGDEGRMVALYRQAIARGVSAEELMSGEAAAR